MLLENMKMALSSLRANKMRSVLTMLGIIIGIGSVISIVSIGDTIRKMFTDIYKDLGVSQAVINIGYWIDQESIRDTDFFTDEDIARIRTAFGDKISYIDSNEYRSAEAKNGRNSLKTSFSGVDCNYTEVQPLRIVSGRFLSQKDVEERKNAAVISESTARKLFGTEMASGKSFRAEFAGELREFHVTGVYRKEMSPFQKLLMGVDDSTGEAYVPWTLLSLSGEERYYQLRYFGKPGMSREEAETLHALVKSYVARSKNRNTSDWSVRTVQEEMKQVDVVMAGISAAVGGIAAISLLVGGIGIMNIMLVSVTERTREIGIRKALGAGRRDILVQFLTESALLSALGGTAGVLLALLLVGGGGLLFGIEIVVKPEIILIAVVFSAVVGVFFGIYPANKAAREDPIVALRYE